MVDLVTGIFCFYFNRVLGRSGKVKEYLMTGDVG